MGARGGSFFVGFWRFWWVGAAFCAGLWFLEGGVVFGLQGKKMILGLA